MSDYVHTGRRSRMFVESKTVESRLMFAACYLPFLLRALVTRVLPWRKSAAFGAAGQRESIFREASSAASVLVSSSFGGL